MSVPALTPNDPFDKEFWDDIADMQDTDTLPNVSCETLPEVDTSNSGDLDPSYEYILRKNAELYRRLADG